MIVYSTLGQVQDYYTVHRDRYRITLQYIYLERYRISIQYTETGIGLGYSILGEV